MKVLQWGGIDASSELYGGGPDLRRRNVNLAAISRFLSLTASRNLSDVHAINRAHLHWTTKVFRPEDVAELIHEQRAVRLVRVLRQT